MAEFEPLLTRRYGIPESWKLEVAEQHGAYEVARNALTTMKPEQVHQEVRNSNIRGRGGAGFPAGVKWGFLDPRPGQTVYLTVNGDESEPGTFKDRTLMEKDPHRVLEGTLLSAYACRSNIAYIYIRGELDLSIQRMEQAIAEARAKGYIGRKPFGIDFPIEIWVHPGAGAYICGEETGMLSSLEGKRGEPKLKPPYPAVKGLFDEPTIVNNIETLASVVDIVHMGGEAWSSLSRLDRDGGARLYGVSGHIKTPGVYEAPVGLTLRELIYDFGGGMLHDDRPLKAVVPGGSSTPVVRPDHTVNAPQEDDPLHPWHGQSEIDVPMGVDTFRALGTMLGTTCAIVMDDTVNMVDACRNLMKFYAHETCGQCTPCREGCAWLVDVLDNMCAGRGKLEDIDLLVDISNNMMGNTICAFSDGTAMPMLGFIRKFHDEFVDVARNGLPGRRLDDGTRELLGRAA